MCTCILDAFDNRFVGQNKTIPSFRLRVNEQTTHCQKQIVSTSPICTHSSILRCLLHHNSTSDSKGRVCKVHPHHLVKSDELQIMASYPHNASSNKGKPWPVYFIVRTSGEVVPLIGVDELPIGTDLVGVPRALDLEDTIGMLNLGIQRSSEAFYQIASSEGKKADIADTAAKHA